MMSMTTQLLVVRLKAAAGSFKHCAGNPQETCGSGSSRIMKHGPCRLNLNLKITKHRQTPTTCPDPRQAEALTAVEVEVRVRPEAPQQGTMESARIQHLAASSSIGMY